MAKTNLSAPQLWIVLARSHRALTMVVERSVADQGLCLSDFMVLEALLHKGPLTIAEIQEKVLLASGSMTAAVDRLENKGLRVRKTTLEDRRARLLELTSDGKRVVTAAFKEHVADLEKVMAVLDEREKQQIYTASKKLGHFAAETLEQRRPAKNKGRK
jgi:MarR family 2-MHQ and catechol resistance regulon transcriptional repressor